MKSISKTQKLKKSHLAAIIVVLSVVGLFFAATSVNELKFMLGGEHYREAKVNTIIKALQEEDVGAIKALLSKSTIKTVGEEKIEEDIRYLFTVFQGEVQSIDMKGGGYSESIDGFNRSKSSSVGAYITTDVDVYILVGPDEIFNSFNRREVGISDLMVQSEKDYDRIGSSSYDFVGIFRQDVVAAALDKYSPNENSLEAVLDALQNDDPGTIAGMFSKRAISEVGIDNIRAGSEYSCDVLEGNIVSWDSSNAEKLTNIIDGKVQMTLIMYCYVSTDINEYTLYFRENLIDEIFPENVGIDRLLTQKYDGSGRWPLKDALGIFCPKNENPREYTSWKPED